MSIRVPGTHFEGPLLASNRAGRGLFDDQPLEVTAPPRASVLYHDYLNLAEEAEYVATNITSGTADIIADVANGVYRLNATTANQGLGSVQYANADNASEGVAAPAAGVNISFEARVSISDVSDCDWFIGLGEVDTTFMDASGALLANGADNHVGWHHTIADAGIPDLSEAGTALANQADVTQLVGTTGAAGNLLQDGTYYRFGIRIEGTSTIQFFIDGRPVSARTTMGTVLADGLVPTFTMIANGSAINMDVDYVLVARTR